MNDAWNRIVVRTNMKLLILKVFGEITIFWIIVIISYMIIERLHNWENKADSVKAGVIQQIGNLREDNKA